jgi:hypothetical protein
MKSIDGFSHWLEFNVQHAFPLILYSIIPTKQERRKFAGTRVPDSLGTHVVPGPAQVVNMAVATQCGPNFVTNNVVVSTFRNPGVASTLSQSVLVAKRRHDTTSLDPVNVTVIIVIASS